VEKVADNNITLLSEGALYHNALQARHMTVPMSWFPKEEDVFTRVDQRL
jgi:hypothetical protein